MELKGEDYRTMLTMTEQESHDAGLNDVGATMRVVDTAGAIFGGASLVKNGVKVLKGGGKKSGHGDGAKGGVPHGHGDGPDGSSGGVMKDGKLKTNAALMPSSLAELGERISQALGKMTAGAATSVPWRVRLMQSVDGRTFMVIVKKDNHMFSDTGGNRGKDGGSGSSKGSPNTSHVDSKESSKGTVSKESSTTSSNVTPVKSKDISKPKDGAKGGKAEATGEVKYKEGYYVEHLTGKVEKVTDWKGVSGGHNYDEFKKFFDENGKYSLVEVNKLEHPDIPGIYDLEYRMKVEIKDYKGKGTGEYKYIPKEDKPPHKKTIYDTNVFSNEDIIRLGKEAMEEGLRSQRISQLKSQNNKQIIRGVSDNGLKFEGIKNIDTGEIENFYPVLKFGEN